MNTLDCEDNQGSTTVKKKDRKNWGFSMTSSILYKIATEAYERCRKLEVSPRAHINSKDPYIAVVFGAISFEGFLNDAIAAVEYAVLARGAADIPFTPMNLFGVLGDNFLEQKRCVKDKVDLLHILCTGEPANWGSKPYQQWELLRELRNMLVHMKPEGYIQFKYDEPGKEEINYPKIIEKLKPAGILVNPLGRVSSWNWQIETTATAKWACDVAREMVEETHRISADEFGGHLDGLSDWFKPVSG